MESSTTKGFSDAIVVWPEDLQYLDNFLQKSFTKVEYEATCEDETKLKPSNLSDLLEYENPNFKRLVSITIKASDEQIMGNSVEIIIGKAGILSSETGIFRLRFKDVAQYNSIENEVLSRFKAMRPWYFRFNKVPFKFLLPLVPFVFALLYNAMTLIEKLVGFGALSSPSPSKFTEGEGYVLVIGLYGILFLVGHLIDRSRDYLFPKYFFCIGRQKKAFEKRRNIAYRVFVLILLGIIINIVSAFIIKVL